MAETRLNVVRRVGQQTASLIFIALCLFISAGSLRWLYAWLYLAAAVVIDIVGVFILPLETIAERGSKKQNTENWDKVLTKLLFLCMFGIFVVAGLDYRWHFSPEMPVGLRLAGIALFFLGCALVLWAMRVNAFFSTTVRIQFDRGHTVCGSGPYRFIRHPGYLGMILYHSASAIFLGSVWALIPAAAAVILFILRAALEDKTLREKLPGYAEYAAKVRFRLIPGVW